MDTILTSVVIALLILCALALLVEAEGQEKVFLEKVYNEPKTTEFEEYYKQFGKPK